MNKGLLLVILYAAVCVYFCEGGGSDRYRDLDKLLDRLGGVASGNETEGRVTTAETPHKRRHWMSRNKEEESEEEGVEDDYDDMGGDYDDDDDDEQDNDEEKTDESPTDDNELASDRSHKPLSDLPTRKPFPSSVSRISDSKWLNSKKSSENRGWSAFRPRPSVKNSGDELSLNYQVYLHNLKMSRETACRLPQLKVIRVSDHYPSGSKMYHPTCTRLHQCSEDTGCCGMTRKCGPKSTKRIELYFYVSHVVGSHGRHHKMTTTIEKLPFYNHTECECQDRNEEMPRDIDLPRYVDQRDNGCKCPSEYTLRHLANGSCSCDCFDKQRDCTKYKKGNEYFNHQDRLCIETGACTVPSCDFGVYSRRSGRCPRKHEKFRSWTKYYH